MWGFGGPSSGRFNPKADDPRRRSKRHEVDSLSCDLGTVLDLSTGGMRVACAGKPPLRVGQGGRIKLRIPEGSLAITGRVVWLRRTGLRRYQMGIEFLNVKKSVATALDRLARFGFIGLGGAADTAKSNPTQAAGAAPKVEATFDQPDYYAILGVNTSATDDDIRDAFRTLARQHHPDVSSDPASQDRFIEIHEAYEILRDPARRKQYDLRRSA
jgi:hypothetical protein